MQTLKDTTFEGSAVV